MINEDKETVINDFIQECINKLKYTYNELDKYKENLKKIKEDLRKTLHEYCKQ